jgi:hypothetical protein
MLYTATESSLTVATSIWDGDGWAPTAERTFSRG